MRRIEFNESDESTYPWNSTRFPERCRNFSVRFALRNSLPATAIVSFPRSGNTFFRSLIEKATGVFTGSLWVDRNIAKLLLYLFIG